MWFEERKGVGSMRIGQWVLFAVLVAVGGVGGYLLRGSSGSSASASDASPRSGFQGQSGTGSFQSNRTGPQTNQQNRTGGRSPIISVQTDTSKSGILVAQRQSAGTVRPVTESQVAAQASGVVSRVLVKVGDILKAGQPVIQLDDTQLRIALQNADLALQNARINLATQTNATRDASEKLRQQLQAAQTTLETVRASYASAQKVYALGGLSSNDLGNVKAQLDTTQANYFAAQSAVAQNARAGNESLAQLRVAISQAQNQLQTAQINLANATLRAPFAGQIAAINVTVGEAVSPSSQPFTLVSAQRQVTFNLPPSDAASITPGQILNFSTGSQNFQVKVDQRPAIPINQNVPLTADIVGGTLPQAGTVGTLTYPVKLAQGTLVPISALQNDGVRNYVFILQGGKARAVTVEVLAQAGSSAAVNGLEGNQEVIVNPPPGLLDGSSVVKADFSAGGSGTPGQNSGNRQGTGSSQANPGSGQQAPAGGGSQKGSTGGQP